MNIMHCQTEEQMTKKEAYIRQAFLLQKKGIFDGVTIPDEICKSKILSWPAKAIFGILKQCSEIDNIFPEQSTLVSNLGLSLSTVQRSIKELQRQKFIKIISSTGQDRLLHKPNQYMILI
jgi:DNA-binding MarR family transcriptional regulator